MIETIEVTRFEEITSQIRGFGIDAPKVGKKADSYTLDIVGWALGRESPIIAVEVIQGTTPDSGEDLRFQIMYQGRSVKRAPLVHTRPDVVASFAPETVHETCGFYITVGILGLPPVADLVLEAVCENGARYLLGSLRVRHSPPQAPIEASINPILITGLGRSGTTWLMQLLAAHDDVVVHSAYPFEIRAAAYWMHTLKVLTEPANHGASAHPDSFLENIAWTGHHPFFAAPVVSDPTMNAWFRTTLSDHSIDYCMRMVDEFYGKVAESQHQQPPRFFAEKHYPARTPYETWLFWELYPRTREIFLVRDFRDVVCSMMSFNKKRNEKAFGRDAVETDEQFIWIMRLEALRVLRAWQGRADRAHLLFYEDLIQSPLESLSMLLDYLGLPSDPGAVEALVQRASVDTAELQFHRTSSSVSSTIGRWRRDLEPELVPVMERAFNDILRDFGYSPSVIEA